METLHSTGSRERRARLNLRVSISRPSTQRGEIAKSLLSCRDTVATAEHPQLFLEFQSARSRVSSAARAASLAPQFRCEGL